jgi:hypothetical protein
MKCRPRNDLSMLRQRFRIRPGDHSAKLRICPGPGPVIEPLLKSDLLRFASAIDSTFDGSRITISYEAEPK